jgi:hypothetical protein
MPYSIEDHKHRYAAWAASRAASTKTCRFNVLQGKNIIEAIGLHNMISTPDLLPSPDQIDVRHREWRRLAIGAATDRDLIGFSDGIAAKLINVYFKGIFVCGGHEAHPNVAALHPPIDSLLLDNLHVNNVGGQSERWEVARLLRWSKLNSDQYEAVISAIKTIMEGMPLWQVEEHWPGHR